MADLVREKTARSVALDLLSYINIKSFRPVTGMNALNRPVITDDDVAKVLTAINGALGLCFRVAPAQFKQQDRSASFYAPGTPTLTLTFQSKTGTISGESDWMLGCTVRIPGDGALNRIVKLDTAAHTFELLYAYQGPTGPLVATVYSDCALLDSDVKTVGEPVQIPNPNRLLIDAGDRTRFDRTNFQDQTLRAPFTLVNKTAGMPIYYMIDTYYNPLQPRIPIFLRLSPMPTFAVQVDYQAELHPILITKDDLYAGTDYDTDPGRTLTSIPAVWVDDIFIPIARKMFAAHPSFKNAAALAQINEQSALANGFLKGQQGTVSAMPKRVRYI